MTRCCEILAACRPQETARPPSLDNLEKEEPGFSTSALLRRILEVLKLSGKRRPSAFLGRFGAHSDHPYLTPIKPLQGGCVGRHTWGFFAVQEEHSGTLSADGKYIPRSGQSLCAAKNDQSLDSADSKKGRVSPFYRDPLGSFLPCSCEVRTAKRKNRASQLISGFAVHPVSMEHACFPR